MQGSFATIVWLARRLFFRRPRSIARITLAALTVAAALACAKALYFAANRTTIVIEKLGSVLNASQSIELIIPEHSVSPVELLADLPADLLVIPFVKISGRLIAAQLPVTIWITDIAPLADGQFQPGSALTARSDDQPDRSMVIEVQGQVATVPLRGVSRIGALVPQSGDVYIDLHDARSWWNLIPEPNRFVIIPIQPESASRLPALTQELRGNGFEVISMAERRIANRRLVAAYQQNLTLLILLAVLVATAAVYAAVEISTQELKSDLDVLRLLGVRPFYLGLLLLVEALGIASLGVLLGETVARPVSTVVEHYIVRSTDSYFKLDLAQELPAFGVQGTLLSLAIAALVAVVGSLLQGRRVARTPASLPSLRQRHPSTPRPAAALCTAVLLLALALLILRPSPFAAYAMLIALLLMGLCIAELLLKNSLPILFVWCRPLIGLVSRAQLLSGFSQIRGTLAATTIAFSLLSGIVVMTESFRISLQRWLGATLTADVFIEPLAVGQVIAPHVVDLIRNQPYVQRVLEAIDTEIVVDGVPLLLAGRDFAQQPTIASGVWNWASWNEGHSVALSEIAARSLSRTVGSSLTVLGQNRTVAAILRDYSEQRPLIYISTQALRSALGAQSSQRLSIVVDAASKTHAAEVLREMLAGSGLTVTPQRRLMNRALEIFDETFAVTKVMLWLAAIMAGFALCLTLLQATHEQRREYHTLWTIGMRDSELFAAILLQGYAILVCALIAGVSSGMALGYILVHYVNPLSFGWSVDFAIEIEALSIACFYGILVMAVPVIIAAPWMLSSTRQRAQAVE
ncbi:MAG: ABC transporter permease [Bdellovibrionota bacterium]|nr:MAG: ABC transporter permease [Bdellovibrionota bacterium]